MSSRPAGARLMRGSVIAPSGAQDRRNPPGGCFVVLSTLTHSCILLDHQPREHAASVAASSTPTSTSTGSRSSVARPVRKARPCFCCRTGIPARFDRHAGAKYLAGHTPLPWSTVPQVLSFAATASTAVAACASDLAACASGLARCASGLATCASNIAEMARLRVAPLSASSRLSARVPWHSFCVL
jgi:hypothetical protein